MVSVEEELVREEDRLRDVRSKGKTGHSKQHKLDQELIDACFDGDTGAALSLLKEGKRLPQPRLTIPPAARVRCRSQHQL